MALPDQTFAFPDPATGARDQTMRMIVRPTLWAQRARFRFSNVFGTRAITLDDAFVGLQQSSAVVARDTNTLLRFSGRSGITIEPGRSVWSDPVDLPFVGGDGSHPLLSGRKLAVSFHVVGTTGPMTWHAKALQTSYVGLPGGGSHGHQEDEAAFPFSTSAWFFLDAVDMMMPPGTPAIVCLGDSITDGSGSTLNGDDRWPDILQRRLHARAPNGVAILNAGIGANQVAGPPAYSAQDPSPGGEAAVRRLERDVIGLSGVSTVIWFEGINDLSRRTNASVETVTAAFRTGVAALRRGLPRVRVIGGTIVSALGAEGNHGFPEEDAKRQEINRFIRSSGIYDAVIDFDAATRDPQTGGLRPEFVPSSMGGPGDRLHPNRGGYLAMAQLVRDDVVLAGRGGH